MTHDYDDISVLIHGRVNYKLILLLQEILKSGIPEDRIILSLWDDVDKLVLDDIQSLFSLKNVYLNKYPSIIGKNNLANRYYATTSSLFGLEKIKTGTVIKFRGDEFYSRIIKIYDQYFKNPEKIITTNIFFRPTEYWPYHIGDHVMMGKTSDMLDMFNRVKVKIDTYDKEANLNLNLRTIANENTNLLWFEKKDIANGYEYYHQLLPFEMLLTVEYLKTKNEIINFSRHKELMNKYFDVMDVNELKPFLISHNSVKKYYRDTKAVEDIIYNMNEIN